MQVKHIAVILLAAILIASAILLLTNPKPKPPQLVAYTTEANGTRTSAFSVNDTFVDVKVSINSSVASPHEVTASWYTPQHHLYGQPSKGWINQTGLVVIWGNSLNNSEISQLVGSWEVDTFIDGLEGPTLHFSVVDSRTSIQPVLGWTWPSNLIKVVVPAQPTYAKHDVIAALQQWNYSQIWFGDTFNLSSWQGYRLVLSNDSSSPAIVISFNSTQTSPGNLGWGGKTTTWSVMGGKLVAVVCSESLDLHYMNGMPVNNVTLENLAMHETGHCLGLNHPALDGDLMNHLSASAYDTKSPSTMNLYAIYELSQQHGLFLPNNTTYLLPKNISYEASPILSETSG
jgi:predicted Zn-dependent protease